MFSKWAVYGVTKSNFKMQDKPINFNVTDYEKFFGMASSSTLSLTFNKLPLVEYSCSIKEKYPK